MSTFTPLMAALLLWIADTMGWPPPGPSPALRMVSEAVLLTEAYPHASPTERPTLLTPDALYDPRTETIVLPASGATLSDATLEALVHELTHALQARQGRLPDASDRTPAACEARYQAEAEAWAVQQRWRRAAGLAPMPLPLEYLLLHAACTREG